MARERMVTRTVSTIEATIMVANPQTQKVENKVFTLELMEEAKILKAVQKQNTTPECVPIALVSYAFKQELYGMPEKQFIALAAKLPPRFTKDEAEV